MNALIREMGGRPRALPADLPSARRLGGVHDFGEHISARRFLGFVEGVEATPLRDRNGNEVPVPAWLTELKREVRQQARHGGADSVDISKLSPHVAVGLGRDGPPDPYAIAMHRLSPHHHAFSGHRVSPVVIEAIADQIQAMRQVRIYRKKPMPVALIREIMTEQVDRGELPGYARDLIEVGLRKQLQLELGGQTTRPYHLLDDSGGAEVQALRAAIGDMQEAAKRAAADSQGDARALMQGLMMAPEARALRDAVQEKGLVDEILEGRTVHIEGEGVVDAQVAVAHMLRTHAMTVPINPKERLSWMNGAVEYILSHREISLTPRVGPNGEPTWVDEWGNQWGGLTQGGY